MVGFGIVALQIEKASNGSRRKCLDKAYQGTATNLDEYRYQGRWGDEDDEDVEELRKSCFEQASLSYSKTAALVQHIVPIETRSKPPPQPVLHLTKKERKRQRKLRRAEKQRELQDMQSAGLIPPPEPRLTLKNFIQVMGDQAFVDPSQMERKVSEQMQARQQAHLERNEAKKLTKEERSEKRTRKLQEDTTESVTVALFWVKDMSHPYHRAKVELNARQNNITGGVLECEHPSMACVICEGGPKAIKRYIRLMTVRMKWQGMDDVSKKTRRMKMERLTSLILKTSANWCGPVWERGDCSSPLCFSRVRVRMLLAKC